MSFLQRKTNAMVGIRAYVASVSSLGFLKEKPLCNLMCKFLRTKNIKCVKWNSKYKGLNTGDVANSLEIQRNWDDFKKFVRQNYPNEQITNKPCTPTK